MGIKVKMVMNQLKKIYKKVKTKGWKSSIAIIMERFIAPSVPTIHRLRWNYYKKKNEYTGIYSGERENKLIISLTTYPKRIREVHITIQSLLMQTTKPDKVILWLANEQFINGEDDLPEELLQLKKYGLDIQWCADYKSYKKLIPTILEFPNEIIITTDDDMYYHPEMLSRLYKAYTKNPSCIHCHRATKYIWKDYDFETIPGGYETYGYPSYLHKLTGCSGVLYPPHSLYKDITNADLFMKLAPTNDDLWFWLMGVLNDTKTNVVDDNLATLWFVGSSQDDALSYKNDSGKRLLIEQRNNIFNYYVGLKEKVIKDER